MWNDWSYFTSIAITCLTNGTIRDLTTIGRLNYTDVHSVRTLQKASYLLKEPGRAADLQGLA